MKKLLALLLTLAMCLCLFTACSDSTKDTETKKDTTAETTAEEKEPVLSEDPVRIFTLKGPTGMGMAKMISDTNAKTTSLNYSFTVAGAADEFVGDIVQGNFELAAVPTNLAATLYAKTKGEVSVVAVNTLGVLYVLENGKTINSIEDLAGKTVYSSGQGAVPEYALNYILEAFGIECEVIYESEHDVVVSDLISGKADIAILPEPKVTAALKNAEAPEGLRIALDLNELWKDACEKKGDDSVFYMGCIIANKSWADEHPAELEAFLKEYKASVDFVNSDETAPQLIADAGIIPAAPVAKAALPNSNIVCITGNEMSKGLEGFLKVLHGYTPASVGGALPEADFYYTGK